MNEETRRAAYEAVSKGWLEVVGEREGKTVFRLTEAGRLHVEQMPDEKREGDDT